MRFRSCPDPHQPLRSCEDRPIDRDTFPHTPDHWWSTPRGGRRDAGAPRNPAVPGETHCLGPWPDEGAPGSWLAVAPPPLTPPPPRSADRVESVPWAVRLPGTAGHPPPAAPSQTSCSNRGTSRQRGRHRGPGHRRPLRVPPTLNSARNISQEDSRKGDTEPRLRPSPRLHGNSATGRAGVTSGQRPRPPLFRNSITRVETGQTVFLTSPNPAPFPPSPEIL